jgi:hypothetical protein
VQNTPAVDQEAVFTICSFNPQRKVFLNFFVKAITQVARRNELTFLPKKTANC